MTESVIDFPKESLCPEVWEKVISVDGINETWQLTETARLKIEKVARYLIDCYKKTYSYDPDEYSVHITGSITSNSYTKNSDIDLHILIPAFPKGEEDKINKLFRAEFEENFKDLHIGDDKVAEHPIEVYFQPNAFQDLMSVGCYDFFNRKWLVGPEMTDPAFNPYSEYFKEIQAKSDKYAQKIRNMILSIYEMAVVYKKNIGNNFVVTLRPLLVNQLSEVQNLYDSIRQMRKVYSSPTSAEQALEYRASRKWKIVDASFKLFDKYGYMAILKQFTSDYDLMTSTDLVSDIDVEVVEDILSTVKNYINNADKLAEKEIYAETESTFNENKKIERESR